MLLDGYFLTAVSRRGISLKGEGALLRSEFDAGTQIPATGEAASADLSESFDGLPVEAQSYW